MHSATLPHRNLIFKKKIKRTLPARHSRRRGGQCAFNLRLDRFFFFLPPFFGSKNKKEKEEKRGHKGERHRTREERRNRWETV